MADEYISRAAAENEISRLSGKPNDWIGKNTAINAVDAIPAADVAEVVRCKDCELNYGTQKAPRCDLMEVRLTPNSYCSCGFRKTDESEGDDDV